MLIPLEIHTGRVQWAAAGGERARACVSIPGAQSRVCQAMDHTIRKGIEKGEEAHEKGGDLCLPGPCCSDITWLQKGKPRTL